MRSPWQLVLSGLIALCAVGCLAAACCQAAAPEQLATVMVIGEGQDRATYYQTGVVVAAEGRQGWALTCAHLFRDPIRKLWVWPPEHNEGPYEAEVLALYHPDRLDLAVLRFSAVRELAYVPLAADDAGRHTAVLQIGFPGGQPQQVNRRGEVLSNNGTLAILSFPVQQGDSGSPVFAGPPGERRVVGIVWGNNGRAHATPIAAIKPALEASCPGGQCPPRGWYPGANVAPLGSGNLWNGMRPRQKLAPPRPNRTTPEPASPAQPLPKLVDVPARESQAEVLARLDALQKELAALKLAKGEPGERGPAGPPGVPGSPGKDASPDLAALQSMAEQYLASRPLTVQVVDVDGQVVDETQVTLGGKLKLKLVPRR